MWLGTYERDYPRARVLVRGLREIGVEVVEHHRPVWERQRHKAGAFLRPGAARAARACGYARAWGGLAPRGRPRAAAWTPSWPATRPSRTPCRPGAWPGPGGCPLVVDMMISLADTLAGDRGRAGPRDRRGAGRRRPPLAAARRPGDGRHRGGRRLARGALRRAARADRGGPGGRRARAASRPCPSPTARRTPSSTASWPRSTASRRCSRRRAGPGVAAAAADRRRAARALARGRARAATARAGLAWERWVPYERLGAEVARRGDLPRRVRHERQGRAGGAEQGVAGDGRRPAGGDRPTPRPRARSWTDGAHRPAGAARRRPPRWPAALRAPGGRRGPARRRSGAAARARLPRQRGAPAAVATRAAGRARIASNLRRDGATDRPRPRLGRARPSCSAPATTTARRSSCAGCCPRCPARPC